jgi:outer membrane receptor for ferric coprogen and ferric-rhodotorulic acid
LVEGRTAPALQGVQTLNEALAKALAGSGLEAVPAGAAITVRRHSSQTGMLGEVTVTAQAEREATEGSGSYAASHVSLGKGQDIRETPQSISVVTRQRIEDQAMSNVGEVMQQTTGVTVDYGGAGAGRCGHQVSVARLRDQQCADRRSQRGRFQPAAVRPQSGHV